MQSLKMFTYKKYYKISQSAKTVPNKIVQLTRDLRQKKNVLQPNKFHIPGFIFTLYIDKKHWKCSTQPFWLITLSGMYATK